MAIQVKVVVQLLILIVIATAVRLYFLSWHDALKRDSITYLELADGIAAFPEGEAAPFKHISPRLAPYLWLLSRGKVWFHIDNERWGVILSCIFGILTVPLVYALFATLFDDFNGAFVAGAAAAVHPALVEYSTQVLREAVYLFFVTAGLLFFIRAVRRRNLLSLVLCGLTILLAAMCRTEGCEFAFLFLAFICIRGFDRPERKTSLLQGEVLSATLLAGLIFWEMWLRWMGCSQTILSYIAMHARF